MDADSAMNGPPPPVIPPFSPRKGVRVDPSAKLSPAFDASVSPPACELLVRGVNAKTKHLDVVASVESAIEDIQKTDSILRLVDVKVRKFGRGKDADVWFSSCYIALGRKHAPSALEGEKSEPRVDLLERLKVALGSAKPEWEVVWTPNATGTDKRMWVRFPEVNGKAGSPGGSQDDARGKILEWAKSKNIVVCKSFTGPSGVTLVLADPKEVDRTTSRRTVSVKGIDQLLLVTKTRQMEIEKPYDLVIKNVPPNHLVRQAIEQWFTNQFTDSDGDSLMDEMRSPDDDADDDCLFFSMLTWAATIKVLSSDKQALFRDEFAASINNQNMSLPMSILAANQIKYSTTRSEKAAENVQAALAKAQGGAQNVMECMQSEMKKMKNEIQGELKAMNEKMDDGFSVVTGRMGAVETVVMQMSRAQMALQFQSQASREESKLRSELSSMRSAWMIESDPLLKAEFRKEMDKLEAMVLEASRRTEAREADAMLMMGGCAPPSIPPPPDHADNPSSSGNASTLVPLFPPGLSTPCPPVMTAPSMGPLVGTSASGGVKRTFSNRDKMADAEESGVWASQHAPKRNSALNTDPDDEMADVGPDQRTESIG